MNASILGDSTIEALAKRAGMITELQSGAASCVWTEGLTAVSADQLNEFARLVAEEERAKWQRVIVAAVELVCAPAWAGISDEDVKLEKALRDAGLVTHNDRVERPCAASGAASAGTHGYASEDEK